MSENTIYVIIFVVWFLFGIVGCFKMIMHDLKYETKESAYEYFGIEAIIAFLFCILLGPISFFMVTIYCSKKLKILKKKFVKYLWELANKTKILFLLFLLIPTLDVNAAAPPTIEIHTLKKEVEKPRTTFTEQESLVLQKIAIAEAQSEGIGGMAFVMQTILNRVESDKFPNTIYDVISQQGQFTTFSNGMYENAQPTENSKKALELLNLLQNKGQLYFEVTSNDSWQSNNLTYVFTYCNHTFYM